MLVPVRLPLAGKMVKIEYVDKIVDGEGHSIWGESINGENHIRVSRSRPDSAEQVWATIYHELVHVTWDISGATNALDEKTEEMLVHGLDNLLAPIIALRPKIPGAKYAEVEFDYEDN